MQIKRYGEFIVERLGVPQNIVESAQLLYDSIVDKFNQMDTKYLFSHLEKAGKVEIDETIPIKILISELTFNTVNFNIVIHLNENYTSVDVASWGVSVEASDEANYKLLYDKQNDTIDLHVNFISASDNNFTDIVDYLQKEKVKTIGILSHELKHVYDKYMIGYQMLSDIIDYQSWSRTSTGFTQLDKFFYYLYLTSESENLVRPSEVAGYIVASDITKSEFKQFLENTRIYKELIEIKNWSYRGLKQDLLNNIGDIRQKFDGIPDSESDLDVLNVVLKIAYKSVFDKSSEILEDILGLNNTIKAILGKIKDSDIEFYNDYFTKRVFNTHDEFFLFWQKKLNFVSEEVIKKISKLYDMCKDDKVNPLMARINDRIEGQCIINPKAYKEIVLGNKVDKVKYQK